MAATQKRIRSYIYEGISQWAGEPANPHGAGYLLLNHLYSCCPSVEQQETLGGKKISLGDAMMSFLVHISPSAD